MKIFGYVYLMLHRESGRVYIGQTTRTIHSRWREHKHSALAEKRNNHLSKAIRKYGMDAFVMVELHRAFSRNELDEMECRAIYTHESTDRRFGFNIGDGGNVIQLFGSDNPAYGRKISVDHRQKMLAGLKSSNAKGKHKFSISLEQRKAISDSLIGNKRAAGPKSEEHKRKISDSRKRYWEIVRQERSQKV